MDAAMILPVFILSVVLILSLMNEATEESRLYKSLCERVNRRSTVLDMAETDIPYLTVSDSTDTRHVSRTVFYRPFWGESDWSEDEYALVCIYPREGVKYHQKYCSTVQNNKNYEVVTRKEAVEMGYLPCKLCYGGPDYFR